VADSVGKIQLDLEITPNSIAQQISAVSRAFASGMQRSFSQMKNFTRGTFSDMARQMRSAMSGGSPVSDDAAMAIQNLGDQMDNASNQAEHYRQKLKDLQRSYDQLTAREQQGTYGQKLREEILRTEERMLRFGEKSDKLRLEIEKLEQSTGQLEKSTGRAGRATEKASRGFARAGESAHRARGPIAGFATSMNRAFTRVLRQVFVFAVLYKAIRGMTSYMGDALNTNQAFVNSLNQVKTNLQVAFMPIYQAILPALNTFMAWLAKATAYIASFTSALFGKTYKQSFQAAKGLEAAKKSLEGTGKAAKKAAGSLAPFDELNILSEPDDGDGGDDGSSGLVAPSVDTSAIDSEMQTLADRVKSVYL
jgi:ABC-type transporter Mla subunit MlaD